LTEKCWMKYSLISNSTWRREGMKAILLGFPNIYEQKIVWPCYLIQSSIVKKSKKKKISNSIRLTDKVKVIKLPMSPYDDKEIKEKTIHDIIFLRRHQASKNISKGFNLFFGLAFSTFFDEVRRHRWSNNTFQKIYQSNEF
jgi:hypothetical protein